MSASIARDHKIGKILQELAEFYKVEPRILIHHLRTKENPYSNRKIASILGISVQALLQKYPLKKMEVNRG